MNEPIIEHIARAHIETFATVGELRTALLDSRIPDEAEIIFAEMSCVNIPAGDDYDVAALESGVSPFEHRIVLDISVEWDLS